MAAAPAEARQGAGGRGGVSGALPCLNTRHLGFQGRGGGEEAAKRHCCRMKDQEEEVAAAA